MTAPRSPWLAITALGIWFHAFALLADRLIPTAQAGAPTAPATAYLPNQIIPAVNLENVTSREMGSQSNPLHVVVDSGCR